MKRSNVKTYSKPFPGYKAKQMKIKNLTTSTKHKYTVCFSVEKNEMESLSIPFDSQIVIHRK